MVVPPLYTSPGFAPGSFFTSPLATIGVARNRLRLAGVVGAGREIAGGSGDRRTIHYEVTINAGSNQKKSAESTPTTGTVISQAMRIVRTMGQWTF